MFSMANLKKRFSNKNQSTIFELIQEHNANSNPEPGSMDIDRAFREAVSLDLKECPLSRYQVVAVMSELIGQDITKAMLDSWTADSKEQHRFPAIFLPAFCEATGGSRTLRLLGNVSKRYVMDGPDALRADIRRDEELIREIRKRKQKKQVVLSAMEGEK